MAHVAARDFPLDLDSCGREPVHLIGHIQSHGLLLALSEPDYIVWQVSANVEALLGVPAGAVLGRSLEKFLGSQQFGVFRSRLRADDLSPASALCVVLGSRGLAMNCVAHRHDNVLIVELERVKDLHSLDPSELAADLQILLVKMERATDLLDYCRVAATQMQRLSGFDRAMVYRFDPEWNGEVIAEAGEVAEPGGFLDTSYLGLRFPASDIPVQARQLFLANPVRAIADVGSAPVPIVPEFEPRTGRPLDLTHTFLRSASLLHIEYLRNMGVAASLTVSIVVDERLWGMITCHHRAPRPVDCLTRSVCEMISRNLALQVALRDGQIAAALRKTSRGILDAYFARLTGAAEAIDAESLRGARLLELLDADGLVACLGGSVTAHGVSVSEAVLQPIIARLRALASRDVASSDGLGALDRSAEAYAPQAAGALYIGLDERTGDYLLFVRRGLAELVTWAGNPDKSVRADESGKLHPRASFAAWQESVAGRSRPWTEIDLENARALREDLRHVQDARRSRDLK